VTGGIVYHRSNLTSGDMEMSPQQAEAPTEPRPRPDEVTLRFPASIVVDVSGLSHPGKVRTNNEDHFLITRFGRYLETVQTSLPPGEMPERTDDAGYAMIVADGMGGHVGGELASRLAIRELVRVTLAMPDWIMRLEESTLAPAVQRSQRRIRDLNAKVIETGRRNPELRGMGSTLTAARNLGRILQIAHVGDSRAYLLRDGTLHRLTRDHTYVQMLVDSGRLTKEEAARSTARHVLTNAVGGFNEDVQVDVEQLPLSDGDRVLLCSDGLSDLVGDEAIRAALQDTKTAADTCRVLVDQALDAGGRDNITAVVARYSWPDPA
jgi:protein phosphatase